MVNESLLLKQPRTPVRGMSCLSPPSFLLYSRLNRTTTIFISRSTDLTNAACSARDIVNTEFHGFRGNIHHAGAVQAVTGEYFSQKANALYTSVVEHLPNWLPGSGTDKRQSGADGAVHPQQRRICCFSCLQRNARTAIKQRFTVVGWRRSCSS